ncbi:MAG: inositol monophosphatase family protein [Patescibacteria group bacterium]
MTREALLLTITKRAGRYILRSQSRIARVSYKDDRKSVVTDIDVSAERQIRRSIQRYFPHDRIIGEELGVQEGSSRYTWIIDPIDGTANYPIGLPLYCTTIALLRDGQIIHATMYDPIHDEFFAGSAHAGVKLNNTRLPRLAPVRLDEAVAAVAFADRQQGARLIPKIIRSARKTRYLGSTAITLAYCAAGRINAGIFTDVSSWDIAAGILLLQEVGGVVYTLAGNALPRQIAQGTYDVIAGNKKTVLELLRAIK